MSNPLDICADDVHMQDSSERIGLLGRICTIASNFPLIGMQLEVQGEFTIISLVLTADQDSEPLAKALEDDYFGLHDQGFLARHTSTFPAGLPFVTIII